MKRSEISHRGLYRSRQGAILGVCRGIANYFDFSVFWTRTIAILLLVFTGFWPVLIIYLGAALLMKPEPVLSIRSEDEREFYDSYAHSRQGCRRPSEAEIQPARPTDPENGTCGDLPRV